MRKGEIACYKQFLLFSQCFSTAIYLYCVKMRHCVVVDWRKISLSRFVWANGRAARIGRAIPVCSIGRLPIFEALPSLPLDIWQSRQRFRNKMAETAEEKRVEEWSVLI